MKQWIRSASLCLVALGFFLSAAQAQVQTARTNVAVSSKCKGYYEYLPEGYDPNGSARYPLILFLGGIGEFGNGSTTQLPRLLQEGLPKLINAGSFPTSFSVLGETHRFIVISPQFVTSPRPSAVDVDTVLRYMLANYKIDTTRVYLTGLSYGGGLSFAYPGNDNASYRARVTAIVPTAVPLPDGGDSTIYARSRNIASGDIAVWATHNLRDRQPDSSTNTIAYITYINQAPGPNPPAKMTLFNAGGHNSWNKTYDPDFRENGYSAYEWMLLHKKGTPPPPANQAPNANAGSDKTITLPTSSVSLTATATDGDGTIVSYSWRKLSGPAAGTITSPNTAATTVTALVAGTYYFRVTASDDKGAKDIDDVKVTVKPDPNPPPSGAKVIQVNVFGGTNPYNNAAWNNWNVGTASATNVTSPAFTYSDGTASGVSAVLSATEGVGDNGSTYGAGMAPAEVLRYTSVATTVRTLTLQGLSTTKTYTVELYASRKTSTQNNNTIFTINGTSVSVNVVNNLNTKAVFASVAPNASGQIVISLDKTATHNYLNGFAVTENTGGGTTTTKYVKTNVFGGTNPYSNAEWNNWNVGTGAGTNKSVSALKYSDGTTSAVSATLSSTLAVSDNGSTYGSGMAPAEVLRYTSIDTEVRTLTLGGLSSAKTYTLELYASRKTSTQNNNTVFTINGTSVSVNVVNNLTSKAVFTNLVPNASGQIVVSMSRTATHNYLNGFILGEITTTTPATAPVTRRQPAEVTPDGPLAGVQVAPNPVWSRAVLTLNNDYSGVLQVQVSDASGKVSKTLRLVKNTKMLRQDLSLHALPKGLYFVTVQMGGRQQTIKISKL